MRVLVVVAIGAAVLLAPGCADLQVEKFRQWNAALHEYGDEVEVIVSGPLSASAYTKAEVGLGDPITLHARFVKRGDAQAPAEGVFPTTQPTTQPTEEE